MVWYFLDVVSPTLAPVLEPVVVDTATSMFPIVLYAWTSVAGMACAHLDASARVARNIECSVCRWP
jgi:hypothetical protein